MSGAEKFGDNLRLIALAQGGDEKATEALLENNAGLLRNICLKFIGRGTEYEDLLQIGTIGMLKAIKSFDTERGCAFSTYAVPLIFGEIRRFLRDDGLIKVCRPQKKLGAQLMRAKEELMKSGVEPRIDDIANACGVSSAEAAAALGAVTPALSLSQPIYGEDTTLESTITAGDESDSLSENIALTEALEKLPPLWRKIVIFRYYRDLSQQATANLLGLSQVKISREEKKIIEFLRGKLG